MFWIGLIIRISRVALSFGHFSKLRQSVARSDLFHILSVLITLSLFIFILRSPGTFGEPRWYFPLALASFVAIGRISTIIIDGIKKYGKPYLGKYAIHAGIIIIVILIGIGGIYQIRQADSVIKSRSTTYSGIKEAGFFLNQISNPEDLIIVQPQPQAAYYSERRVMKAQTFTGW